MTTFRIAWREMQERRSQMAACLVSIALGIAIVVGIKTIGFYSEKAVARQLDELGTNVLILPKNVTLSDYYTADVNEEVMPESYAGMIASSELQGVDNLSPKLTAPVELNGDQVLLTGILPKNELASKSQWAQAGGIFARPEGCGTVSVSIPGLTPQPQPAPSGRAAIDELKDNEVLLGSEVASRHSLQPGDTLSLQGATFTVRETMPEIGSVEDDRVFAHLHMVQRLLGKPGKVSGIEMIGCCKELSKDLVAGLNRLLPDARVVTIKQIVATQTKTNVLMAKLSLIFLVIIVLVGGASIANHMQANVLQRQKEIGTFMAVGMPAGTILKVFLLKALFLGLVGGLAGYVVGSIFAVVMGPKLAQVPVLPLPLWLVWSLLLALATALLATLLPAAKAARLDPVIALREL